MKNKLTLLFLIFPLFFFSQNKENSAFKTVSGFVNYKNKPIKNATISIKNSTRYSISDAKGYYNIKAKKGDFINLSYVGLYKVSILIEDVTSILNIDLKNRIIKPQLIRETKLGGSNIGENFDSPIAVKIDGNSLNKNATSLTQAIQEKVSYLKVRYNKFNEEVTYIKGRELDGPVIWEIDNVIFDIPYTIFLSEVKDVYIFNDAKQKPYIRVNTNINYKTIKDINYNNYHFTDEDYYNIKATPYRSLIAKKPYLDKYKSKLKGIKLLEFYNNNYDEDKNITNFHCNVFNKFKKEKKNHDFLLKTLSDYEKIVFNNPEDLKAIAYKYQEINEDKKALDIYKKIVKLRPTYLQSYRDVANTLLKLGRHKDVWLTYNYLLKKGFLIEENDIGEIISSEIISAFNSEIKINIPKIKIDNPKKNIDSDVRVVFEWNTSEAEFIIEFVNPNQEVYQIENSLERNQELIIDQKKKGYTSKEIFIESLNVGKYLINLTYLGNKKNKSTSFKITTYYNWGRPNQNKKIEVFDLHQKNKKVQLIKLSRRFLR